MNLKERAVSLQWNEAVWNFFICSALINYLLLYGMHIKHSESSEFISNLYQMTYIEINELILSHYAYLGEIKKLKY